LARKKSDNEEKAYRVYVTDALMSVYQLNMRYYDIITSDKITDDRSADEIINSIISKIEDLK
jgi:hypothetical protein